MTLKQVLDRVRKNKSQNKSDFEGIKRGLCIEILIEISGNGKRSKCLPSQWQVTSELGSAGHFVKSGDPEQ